MAPAAVAIDSPPGSGRDPGSTSRACERQMRELGVNIFLTPSDPERFAGSFYDWIRVGTQVFATAATVGYPAQDDPAVVRGHAWRCSPTPAMCSFEAFSHHPRRLEESPASELGGWRHCNPLASRPAACVSTELVSPLWIPSTRHSPRLRRAGPSTVRTACWATRASGSWCREPSQPGSSAALVDIMRTSAGCVRRLFCSHPRFEACRLRVSPNAGYRGDREREPVGRPDQRDSVRVPSD